MWFRAGLCRFFVYRPRTADPKTGPRYRVRCAERRTTANNAMPVPPLDPLARLPSACESAGGGPPSPPRRGRFSVRSAGVNLPWVSPTAGECAYIRINVCATRACPGPSGPIPPCGMAHGGSRGEAAVVNSSARVSGRQSRLHPPIICVAPAGARPLYCRPFPWLPAWATLSRRYAACLRSLYFRMVCFGQPDESPTI